ncbi:mitochondrial amidoxime reducing component 2 isoform X5 [Pipistrellus kuhlii]|uniref:mitochondrial amidoxime reducing component 2 isoform X5 n=1 Tax=Pipistrellus kuhlii TaxID=59472 RepID=UPI00174EE0CE|nr:mitochondrial amidoxime reducing component 2 isoform X5 [Pipistrellus kuhlii]
MGAAGSQLLGRLGGPRRAALPGAAWLGAAALGLGAAALGTVLWRRRARRPRRRQQVGTVAELWIFPVKSCKGVAVREAEGTALGLRCGRLRDRFWLVIKEDGHMVSARQEPRLVLVSIAYEDDCLVFSAPGFAEQLVLPTKLPSSNRVHNCRIFGLDVKGRDCGDEAAQWFTGFLKSESFRLVQFEQSMKGRASRSIFPSFVQNYQVAYSDGSPIHIISEASLADLNTRLEKKVKMDQFRPNIVVTGCGAFEEDTWDEIQIGSMEMKKVLACPRCIMTTVDPDTGVIDRKEPLETLKSYRLCDPSEQKLYGKSPLFGQYLVPENPGTIRVGDAVYLLDQ